MKVAYFVMREPKPPQTGEAVSLAQFFNSSEALERAEKEARRPVNKGYRIYLYAASDFPEETSKHRFRMI